MVLHCKCPFFDECNHLRMIPENFEPQTVLNDEFEVCLEQNVVISLDKFNDYFKKIKPIIERFIEDNQSWLDEIETKSFSGTIACEEKNIYNIFRDYISFRDYARLSGCGAQNMDIGKNLFLLYQTCKKILDYISKQNKEE